MAEANDSENAIEKELLTEKAENRDSNEDQIDSQNKDSKESKKVSEEDESEEEDEEAIKKEEEAKQEDKPIGRKLQLLLLIPLLSSLLISTLIVVGTVFITQQTWVKDTQDYLINKEVSFMENYLYTVSSQVEISISLFYINLYSITKIFTQDLDGEIQASSNLQYPNPINAYDALDFEFPDTNYSEWVIGSKGYTDSVYSKFNISDAFLRTIYYSTAYFLQIGFITNEVTALDGNGENLMYLYPVENMSYISDIYNYSATCKIEDSEYSPQCTESYSYLFGSSLYILVYYENGRLFVLLKFDEDGVPRAGVYVVPQNYLTKRMLNDTGYKSFACEMDGKWTLFVNGEDPESFIGENKEISLALYGSEKNFSREDFRNYAFPYFNLTEANGTISFGALIDKETTYFAMKRLNFTTNEDSEYSYVVSTYRSESDVLKNWNKFIDDVLIIMIIQSCILVGFILLSVLVALRLALVINHRISQPIESITNYLLTKEPPLHLIQKSFNEQINSILHDLEHIEEIEKFIDPHFLMNQTLEIRMANLDEARNLFEKIDNKRGIALILNLQGNIKFLDKKFAEAENYYREAMRNLEELLANIENQEKLESVLTDAEKKKIFKDITDISEFWLNRKRHVQEALVEQIQQVCEAAIIHLKSGPENETISSIRGKWKEVISLQSKALQFYHNSRENCVDYMNLLIKMAEVFHVLNYYHTAKELLDIVYEELFKINSEKVDQIDIDIGRLRKLGIQILDSDKKKHFIVGDFTFEKDILLQKLFYLRGLINLDTDMYYLAARDFQQAVVFGTYFDQDIRNNAIKELHNLFKRFDLMLLVPDMHQLYKNMSVKRDNYLFGLAFDLNANEVLALYIINFVRKLFNGKNHRFGAINKNMTGKNLELYERDFPDMDLENLVIQSRSGQDNEFLIDLMVRGHHILNQFDEKGVGNTYFIVFYKKEKENFGFCNLEQLASKITENVKIIFVNFGEIFRLDFEIFIENSNGETIEASESEFYKCEEIIRNIIETS